MPEERIMPEEALAAANTALERMERIAKDIHRANVNQRVMMGVVSLLAVMVILVSVLALSAHNTSTALKANSKADAARVEDIRRIGCRSRNSANQRGRDQSNRWADLLGDRIGNTPFVQQLRDAILPREKTDLDCNGDGILNQEDYLDN
jgi:hypothetical protein